MWASMSMPVMCVQVREKVKLALTPQVLQQPEALPPLPYWPEVIQQLTGPPLPQRACLRTSEQLQATLQRVGQRHSSRESGSTQRLPPHADKRPPAESAQPQRGRFLTDAAAHGEAGAGGKGQASDKAARAPEGDADKGVFFKARKRARAAPRQERQDAAFFMGLQTGVSEAASEVSGSSDDSLAAG